MSVGGDFRCSYNDLTSLLGCPEKVVNFFCNNNKLLLLDDFRCLVVVKNAIRVVGIIKDFRYVVIKDKRRNCEVVSLVVLLII